MAGDSTNRIPSHTIDLVVWKLFYILGLWKIKKLKKSSNSSSTDSWEYYFSELEYSMQDLKNEVSKQLSLGLSDLRFSEKTQSL